MLREGQTRIPSGCAISGIFSKRGKAHERGGHRRDPWRRCMTVPTAWAADLLDTASIRNIKIIMRFMFFMMIYEAKETCERFLERHFDIINLSKIPVRKIPAITDEPLIWRYFVHPLPTKLADSQLDEEEFVAQMRHSHQRQH